MNMDNEIFFSYAWGDEIETDTNREQIVNDLYNSLLKENFKVVRDKYSLEYKRLISDFIGRIGKGKIIIVAISEKYLKSSYCMFELYEIARNSNFDKTYFTDKILPVMVEFIDFTKPTIIQKYFSYWQDEYDMWDALVKKYSSQLAVEQLQRYDNIKMIFQNFGRLTEWIIDMNALSPRILSTNNFAHIKNEIFARSMKLNEVQNASKKKVFIKSKTLGVLLWGGVLFTAVLIAKEKFFVTPDLLSHVKVVTDAGEKLLIVQDSKSGKFGYSQKNNNKVLFISAKYDEAGPFKNGIACVKMNGKYSYIKPDAAQAFPGSFDQAEDFIEGTAMVTNNGETFYINTQGKSLSVKKIEPQKRTTLPETKIGKEILGTETGDDDDKTVSVEMCKGRCYSKGSVGVEVSFFDATNKRYSFIPEADISEFEFPCSLLEKPVKVSFKKGTQTDDRNVILRSFEIPEIFRTTNGS